MAANAWELDEKEKEDFDEASRGSYWRTSVGVKEKGCFQQVVWNVYMPNVEDKERKAQIKGFRRLIFGGEEIILAEQC